MTDNLYQWWRDALAAHAAGKDHPPVHDGEPQMGFYRIRHKDGQQWESVAYWRAEDGELRCRIWQGEEKIIDVPINTALEKWPYWSKHPVSYEAHQAFVETGNWPDHSEAVTLSNQAPPDSSIDALRDRIDDIAREADKITELKTQDEADRAADLKNKLGELEKQADAGRVEEKRPHDEAARAVQQKWIPVIDRAKIAKQRIAVVIGLFLRAKEARERAEREEQARRGIEPEPQPRGSTTKAGTRGRAVALRTLKRAEIKDYRVVQAFFADTIQMKELVQDMANRAVRAGVTVPGVEVIEEKIAA